VDSCLSGPHKATNVQTEPICSQAEPIRRYTKPKSRRDDSVAQSDFDLRALYDALDEQRCARQLSWAAATREINRHDVAGSGWHPIATSTITALRDASPGRFHVKGEHCDIVVAELVWLNRTPESFVPGTEDAESERFHLPELGDRRNLRVHTKSLHAALNAERQTRGLTWKEAAGELGIGSSSPLTNLAQGGRTGIRMVMRIAAWLGQPAATFVRATDV